MDLLGSILTSMDAPPTPSEKEKKVAKEMKKMMETEQQKERQMREEFRKKVVKQIAVFMDDSTKKRLKCSPMDKVYRSILHEVAETAGLIAHSFGLDEVDRYVMLFKKEFAPTDEELQSLRAGQAYDPTKKTESISEATPSAVTSDQSDKSQEPQTNYLEKYRHLISPDISEPAPIRAEPERNFGFVPSANKRDLRSIDETLQELSKKKRVKIDTSCK